MSNRKLRVLLATHICKPVGGINIYYNNLLVSSYSQYLDVHVVETSKGNMDCNERGGFSIANWLNASVNILNAVVALWKIRPNIIHIGSAQGASFAKHSVIALIAHLMHTDVVMELHCSVWRLIPMQDTLWKRYVLFILQHVDGIVVISKEWDILLKLLPNVRTCYVPNAIILDPYIALSRTNRNKADKVNILFLGHIGHEKGCFDLISAIDQLRKKTPTPFCLHFVGETLLSGEKELLQTEVEVRDLKPWIQIHAPKYNDEKIACLAMSDIFVLPSYHEGMPISVIEAMASGLPVVATAVGGITEQVVSDQTGLLISPGDVEALANAILRLIENPGERLKMGQAGRQRAIEQYDIETKAQKLITFYHQLLYQC